MSHRTTDRPTHLLAALAAAAMTISACGGGSDPAAVSVGTRSDQAPSTTVSSPSSTLDGASRRTDPDEPLGIIALGHSGLTAENSDPAQPGDPAVENSWATGTNGEVNSIYQRLIAVRPETDGHVANTAMGGAPVDALADQARRALEVVPNPQLVIVQTIDNDIRCDGSDARHVEAFGAALADALEIVTVVAPDAHILVVGQLGRPRPDFITELVAHEPALLADMTGEGVCDFFGPDGTIDLDNVAGLTTIIESYEDEQARVCATIATCATDRGTRAAYVDTLTNLSSDLNHLNVDGQAAAAALVWPVVADLLGVESDTESAGTIGSLDTDGATADPGAGPDSGLRVVALGDSILYNGPEDCPGCTSFVDRYADALGAAAGRPVSVENKSRHDGLTLPMLMDELPTFEADLREADAIIVGVAHNSIALNEDHPCGSNWVDDANTFDDWSKLTADCATRSTEAYRAMYEDLYSTIATWRDDEPTVLLTINRYNDWIGWTDGNLSPDQDATTVTFLDIWNAMLCEAAGSQGFTCVDVYHAFNGPDGSIEAGDLLAPDHAHLSDRGNELVARLLVDAGFAPIA